jgi:hypothetical protein
MGVAKIHYIIVYGVLLLFLHFSPENWVKMDFTAREREQNMKHENENLFIYFGALLCALFGVLCVILDYNLSFYVFGEIIIMSNAVRETESERQKNEREREKKKTSEEVL